MSNPEDLLAFWLEEVGPSGWYEPGEGLDQKIRDRYAGLWKAARAEDHLGWVVRPRSALAIVILLDQFPRNMFRGTEKAFSSDALARAIAKQAIDKKWDLRVAEPERQFFYLPLMHSECLGDQDRCVRLIKERLPESGGANLLHAKAHREIIRLFGRFPARNGDLGRTSTPSERSFLDGIGYGGIMKKLKEAA